MCILQNILQDKAGICRYNRLVFTKLNCILGQLNLNNFANLQLARVSTYAYQNWHKIQKPCGKNNQEFSRLVQLSLACQVPLSSLVDFSVFKKQTCNQVSQWAEKEQVVKYMPLFLFTSQFAPQHWKYLTEKYALSLICKSSIYNVTIFN